MSPALSEKKSSNRVAWAILPNAAFFALFFLLPLSAMLLMSAYSDNPLYAPNAHLTIDNYFRFFEDSYNLAIAWNTIRLSLWTTGITLLVGYPFAYWIVRTPRNIVRVLLTLAVMTPMLTGIVVRTYSWMTLLSDNGVINSLLQSLDLIDRPLSLMYNDTGIVIALVHIYMPFMVLSLVGVLAKIDLNLERAAANLGAPPWRVFIEVTLPLSVPGIAAGSLLVFAMGISAYVTPALIGGFRVLTLPILIYQNISGTFDPYYASALGMILLAISLFVLLANGIVAARFSSTRRSRS